MWISNSVANNVDKLKYQSLVNMDGFAFMKLWWILMNNCTGSTFTSIFQYITTTPWLQIVNIFGVSKMYLQHLFPAEPSFTMWHLINFNLSNNISNIDLSARYFWYKFPQNVFPPFPQLFFKFQVLPLAIICFNKLVLGWVFKHNLSFSFSRVYELGILGTL